MWQEQDKQLYRKFEFKDFKEAFEFIEAVAELAEELNHHPTWSNTYNKVEIWLSTHSAKAITTKDKQMAQEIDKLYGGNTAKKGLNKKLKLYSDGGSRGNPGHSAIAFVICNLDDNVVEKSGKYIGETTNNQAEYQGLLAGLQRVQQLADSVEVYMDSELVVKQINGLYKIKNNELKPIYDKIIALKANFKDIKFIHVPRAMNSAADAEVNRILDERKA